MSPPVLALSVFFGVPMLALATVVGFDVWVFLRSGREATISHAMDYLRVNPLMVFLCGFSCGAVVVGLAVHFWDTPRASP